MIRQSLFLLLFVFTGSQAGAVAASQHNVQTKRARGIELLSSVLKPTMKELAEKVGDFQGPNPFTKHAGVGGDFENRSNLTRSAANLISVIRKHYPFHHVATLGRDAIYIADIFEMLEMVLGGGHGVTRLGASGGSVKGVEGAFLNHNGLLSTPDQPIKAFVAIDPTNWHSNSQLRSLVQSAYSHYGLQGRTQDLHKYVAGVTTHSLNSGGHFIIDRGTTTPEKMSEHLRSSGANVSGYILNSQTGGLAYTANSIAWHGSYQAHAIGPSGRFINPAPGPAGTPAAKETILWIMYEIGAVITDPGFMPYLIEFAQTQYHTDIRPSLKVAFDKDTVRSLIAEKGVIAAYKYIEKETFFFYSVDGVKHFLQEALNVISGEPAEKDQSEFVTWTLGTDRIWDLLQDLQDPKILRLAMLQYQNHVIALDPRKQDQALILTRYFSTPILSAEETLSVWQNTMEKIASVRRFSDAQEAMSLRLSYLKLKPLANYRPAVAAIETWLTKAKITAPQRVQFWAKELRNISKSRLVPMTNQLAEFTTELLKASLEMKTIDPLELASIARSASEFFEISTHEHSLAKNLISQQIQKQIQTQAPTDARALVEYLSPFWQIKNLGLEETSTEIYIQNLPKSVEGTLEAFHLVPSAYRNQQLASAVQGRLIQQVSSRLQLEASRPFLTDQRNRLIPQTLEIVRRLIGSERGETPHLDFLLKELSAPRQSAIRDFELLYLVELLFSQPPVSDSEGVRKLLTALKKNHLPWASALMLTTSPPVLDMQGLLQSLRSGQAGFDEIFEYFTLFIDLLSQPLVVPSEDPLVAQYFARQYSTAPDVLRQILNATVNLATQFSQLAQIANVRYPFPTDLYEAIFHPALHLAPDFKTAMTLIQVFPRDMAFSYIALALDRFPDQGDRFLDRLLELRDHYQIAPQEILQYLPPENVLQGNWQGHRVIELLNLLDARSELRTSYSKAALEIIDVKYAPFIFTADKKVRKNDLASEWQEFRNKAYEREKDEIGFISATARRLRRRMGWNGPVGSSNLIDPCQQTLLR